VCSFGSHFVLQSIDFATRCAYIPLMSVLVHSDYRTYLKTVLLERNKQNPQYSLRAMATKLDVAPSYLSAVIKGKKNFSPDKAVLIASKLHLNESEADYFCLLVQLESAKNPTAKESLLRRAQALNPDHNVHDLNVDHFKIISDWHHFAIMRATEMTNFKATATNLAKALGIAEVEVEQALGRLVRLEMIEKCIHGNYRKTVTNPRMSSISPNEALRNFHRQTLQKASESLESQSPKEKIIGSETICIDSDQIESFRELAEEYFSKVLELSKKQKKKDRVYHLGVQFFNFTHSLESKEKTK
jgi:uncharacterized protein (TIGR02147 family)